MNNKKHCTTINNSIDSATTTSHSWGHVVAGKGGHTTNAEISDKDRSKGHQEPQKDIVES